MHESYHLAPFQGLVQDNHPYECHVYDVPFVQETAGNLTKPQGKGTKFPSDKKTGALLCAE